jgi:hypothetical protein
MHCGGEVRTCSNTVSGSVTSPPSRGAKSGPPARAPHTSMALSDSDGVKAGQPRVRWNPETACSKGKVAAIAPLSPTQAEASIPGVGLFVQMFIPGCGSFVTLVFVGSIFSEHLANESTSCFTYLRRADHAHVCHTQACGRAGVK